MVFQLFKEIVQIKNEGLTIHDLESKAIEINDKVNEVNRFESELKDLQFSLAKKESALFRQDLRLKEREKQIETMYEDALEKQLSSEVNELEKKKQALLDELAALTYEKDRLKETISSMTDYNIQSLDKELATIELMSGLDFEVYCSKLLNSIGFSEIKVTSGSGDQGIDILCRNGRIKYGFQCKKYSKPVGNKSIQEVLAGKVYYTLDRAVVITNSFFTKSAKDLAAQANIELWDRETLEELIREKT